MESTEQTNYAAADDEDSGGTKKRVTTTTKATLENHGVQTSVLSLQNAETQTVKEKKTMTKVCSNGLHFVNESITNLLSFIYFQNIGVGTNGFPETEKTAAVKVVVETTDSSTSPQPTPPPLAMTTVGVDTTDLVPPSSKKKVPPPPPPKPKEVNLDELKKRHLGMEFQFCLGHEPEHHPDEEPPYIVVVGEEHQPSAVAEESSKPEMIGQLNFFSY
jgi:hypothetical protein